MDCEEGMDILSRDAWLRDTPVYFRDAILSQSRWERLEAGASIQTGGEEDGEMSGLAHGIVELRTVLGRSHTAILHFARPVFWIGYCQIIPRRRRHPVQATAKTTAWAGARVSRRRNTAAQ